MNPFPLILLWVSCPSKIDMKSISLIFILSFFVLLGCSDDDSDAGPNFPVVNFDDGTIILGQDDCSYLLSFPDESFKPVNLDASFQQDGLRVKGKYQKTGGVEQCGLKNFQYNKVRVIEIQNR